MAPLPPPCHSLAAVLCSALLRRVVPWAWLGALSCGGATTQGGPLEEPIFVAVGAEGAILISSDAVTWEAEVSGTGVRLNGVAASGALFVAVGERGTILTSRTGRVWTSRSSGTEVDLAQVMFEGGQFVAVGGGYSDRAVVLTSLDGIGWRRVEAPPQYSFTAVASARGTILAAAVTPSTQTPMALDRVVLASVPPSTSNRGGWIPRELPSFSDAVRLGDNAEGETLTVGSWNGESTLSRLRDSETWSTEAVPLAGARAIAAAPKGSRFVIVGASGALESLDGRTWTESRPPIRTGDWLMAVAHGAATFAAVGLNGTILTSPEGFSWSPRDSGVTADLLDITFGPAGL